MGWFYLTLVKRKRIRTIAVIVLVLCLLFIIYQMIIIYKLSSEELTSVNKLKLNSEHEIVSQLKTISNKTSEKRDDGLSAVSVKKLVKGVLFSDLLKYSPNAKGNFICPVDKFEIIFSKVNDDYCDCPSDGSDEPGTNACQNGKFYCSYQSSSSSKPTFIPSSHVNDGICDCCDGSDEWNGFTLDGRLSESEQKRLGRYESPCSNFCK